MYKMAKDCLERGQDIFNTARKEQRPLALFRMATPSPTVSPTLLNYPPASQHPFQHGPSHSSSFSSQPRPQNQQPHPSSTAHTTKTLQYARNAPQNLGIRTGPNHTYEGVASRNMSWPSSRRVPGTKSLPRGMEMTDSGIDQVRGAGPQQQQQQPNR